MKSKKTKKALTGSVLALVLCFVMLLGTTFAWFTDTASTAVNKIVAGTLDVELLMQDDNGEWQNAEGKKLEFLKAEGHEDEEILWEPGCEYWTPNVRIKNNGTLALKFKVELSGLDGDAKLAEVLDWGTFKAHYDAEGKQQWGWNTTDGTSSTIDKEFILLAGEYVDMQLYCEMLSTAGNEYQGLTIDDFAITVYATQWTEEYDSYSNQYDKYAEYAIPVSSESEFKAAIAAGDNVILADDVVFSAESVGKIHATGANGANKDVNVGNVLFVADESVDIDLNGHILSGDAKEGIVATGNITVNIYDSSEDKTGGITVSNSSGCALYAMNGATINVYSGNYKTGNVALVVAQYGGTINIYGGKYESTSSNTSTVSGFMVYGVNEAAQGYSNTLNVYGGSYKGFDPSSASEQNLISVADGYTVAPDSTDTWYTVSK